MLVIRLARQGRKKYPVYRIVAAEKARAPQSKFVEILGHYNPHTKELSLDKEATQRRLQTGAQPSNTVVKLLQHEKMELPKWVSLKTRNRKPKKEPEAPAETASEPTEQVAEAEPAADEGPAVAVAATEAAAQTEDNQTSPAEVETAEDTAAAAENAEAAQDAAANAAAEKPEEAPGAVEDSKDEPANE